MKKFFSLLLALATIGSASASVILHESFDGYEADATLSAGRSDASTNDRTHWYDFANSGADITIAEGSLSYAGYVSEGKGGKAKLAGNGLRDLRQFNAVSTGKVYAAAIINAEALKASTTAGQFLALGDASNSGLFARLYVRSVKDGDDFVGYNLGISKSNESYYRWSSETLLAGKDYLVVLEYEFVDGTQNDITRLYINPTAEDQTPTLECVQDSTSASGVQNGAKGKADANYIASINLSQNTYNPNPLYVDEIKVATEWADLFEGGAEDNTPVITVQDNFAFETELAGYFTGDPYTGTLVIGGQNLTEDITLSSSTAEISFEKSTISAAEATAEGGVSITATLVPNAIEGEDSYEERNATITLTSGEATATLNVNYMVFSLTHCADIAALKEACKSGEAYSVTTRFEGNAVVTYIQQGLWSTVYTIEDATGAINVEDETSSMSGIELGDEVTSLLCYNGEASFGILPVMTMGIPVQTVSKNKEIEPQVVTLAELQTNPEEYLLELVQVKGVAFDEPDVLFSAGDFTITQDEYTANVNILAGNTLIGEVKPAKANVTGVSSAANGQVLRPRWAEDIEETDDDPTGIEEATFEAGIEIYTIQGMRVESLQPGVNIIHKGNTIYKVVR